MTSPISSIAAMIRLQKSVPFHNITCAMLNHFLSSWSTSFPIIDANAPSFFVDDNPVPISIANETHPTCACNPHCLHQLVCTGASAANRHPCFAFLLNLSSISSLFSLRSIPKKMSYVLLCLFMYKFSLLQGKPWSKRHIIVIAGLSASDLLGFLASPQMFALAVFTLHQILGVILLAVSVSDKPLLQSIWFPLVGKYSVLSNSAGLLKPHSLRQEHPLLLTLSFLVSSLSLFLPLASHGVEFQLHRLARSCSFFASFLCCPSSFHFSASSVMSFLSFPIAPPFLAPTFLLSTFFRLRIV